MLLLHSCTIVGTVNTSTDNHEKNSKNRCFLFLLSSQYVGFVLFSVACVFWKEEEDGVFFLWQTNESVIDKKQQTVAMTSNHVSNYKIFALDHSTKSTLCNPTRQTKVEMNSTHGSSVHT